MIQANLPPDVPKFSRLGISIVMNRGTVNTIRPCSPPKPQKAIHPDSVQTSAANGDNMQWHNIFLKCRTLPTVAISSTRNHQYDFQPSSITLLSSARSATSFPKTRRNRQAFPPSSFPTHRNNQFKPMAATKLPKTPGSPHPQQTDPSSSATRSFHDKVMESNTSLRSQTFLHGKSSVESKARLSRYIYSCKYIGNKTKAASPGKPIKM